MNFPRPDRSNADRSNADRSNADRSNADRSNADRSNADHSSADRDAKNSRNVLTTRDDLEPNSAMPRHVAARDKPDLSLHRWRPRGLFFKIFGWFLAAQLLIALALYALATATQRNLDQTYTETVGDSLTLRARAAAIAYENGGANALSEAWQSERNNSNFGGQRGGGPPDDDGPPDGVPSDGPPSDGGSSPDGPPPDGFGGRRGPGDRESASLYVLRAVASNPAQLSAKHLIGPVAPSAQFTVPSNMAATPDSIKSANGATYLLRRVQTARGGRYVAVLRLRLQSERPGRSPLDWLGGGPNQPAAPWRFGVIGLTMGALCYALARYLTDPTLKLRRATRQFAAGDFAARVGPQMGRRRDELADLGHDFDRMAERIEALMLTQRQLLGDISHELRSPLTRLTLALDLAAQSADAPTRALLSRIEVEAGEMNRLIGQLLTIARLENGASAEQQSSREAAYIDLAGLLEHVAANADFEAKSRGGTVSVTHLEDCQIVGSGELLLSALENVVRNAILHGPPSGALVEISLHIEAPEGARFALIRVRDYGPGVPDEALELLFRPFFRVDAARARNSGGTGLGLSIAQRAARFHGGDMSARNAPGGGLEVEISLPLPRSLDAANASE